MSQLPRILTSDELDDLIYYSRTGDLVTLKDEIQALSKSYDCSPLRILQSAVDVDHEGLGSGSCLLHYPAANGNLAIVQHLLSLGPLDAGLAHTSAQDDTGAMAKDLTEPARLLKQFINHQNVSGNTPLHWAGMNGHLDIVKALVEAGADPEIVNEAGRDAVVESEWSTKEGAADCAVWMLRKCGTLEKGLGKGGEDEQEADEESDIIDQHDGTHDSEFDDVQPSPSGTTKSPP